MNITKIPRDHKEQLIDRVQQYFEAELDGPIGNLAAEQLIDFMTKQLGPILYNQAIHDARQVIVERFQSMEDELYALERPLSDPRAK